MALDDKQGDMDNLHSLHLDEDEIEHRTKIEPEVYRTLQLANRGAVLSLAGIADGCNCKTPIVGSSTYIEVLLVMKAANLIRLAIIALSLGYYPGCSVLLRAAFETVAYLFLFIAEPDEIKVWLRFQLHPTLDTELKKQIKADEREQLKRAKIEFSNRTSDAKSERELMKMFWTESSQEVHVSADALSKIWGLEPWELLPQEELAAALELAGDDFGYALDLLALRAVSDQILKKGAAQRPGQIATEEIVAASYLENDAFILSSMSLLLSHRIADIVFLSQDVLEVGNANLKKDFKKWHGDVKKWG